MELAGAWARKRPLGNGAVRGTSKKHLREFWMQRGTRIVMPFMKDQMRFDTASRIRMLQETARTLAAHRRGG